MPANSYRAISPPVEVHWAGFESTLHKLSHYGWQVARHYREYDDGIQFILHHPQANMHGMTSVIHSHDIQMGSMDMRQRLSCSMDLARSVVLHMYDVDKHNISLIDTQPAVIREEGILSLSDIFPTIIQPTTDVLLDQLSLDEVLSIAQDKQKPINEQWARMKHEQKILDEYRQASQPAALLRLVS